MRVSPSANVLEPEPFGEETQGFGVQRDRPYRWASVYRQRCAQGLCLYVSMDYKLELVAVPVSDVDRAKPFYVEQVGFNADHDHRVNENMRFVQLTPPGSACSIASARASPTPRPAASRASSWWCSDIEAAKAELSGRGVEVGEVQRLPLGRFLFFTDPDGNAWAIQDRPGRAPASSLRP